MSTESTPLVDLDAYGAWLFDVDGVLTRTATVHATAWKMAFDSFLAAEGARTGTSYAAFDEVGDFENYVNGMPREDGVRDFLGSRGITLPEGVPDDPPDARTVNGVANAKNEHFQALIASRGIVAFEGAVRLVRDLRGRGVKVGVVSSSKNMTAVLSAAGIADLFDARVDGHVVEDRHLAGKPAPDSYLEGVRMLGVEPASAVVVEDALAGVAAGRAGRFGLVVGVDHHDAPGQSAYADDLRAHGANVVVSDLASLIV